jgi:lysophospholipase L1-like esterase
MRNDIGVGSPINEQIKNYNKKLHKVTKRFRHVKLARVTTNREHFTKHGLHLNNKGKEIMSKELLKNLPTKHGSQKVAAIQLPWRNESIK